MKVLITGASGFLGRATVAETRALGHKVCAMIRPASKGSAQWAEDAGIQIVRGDLRDKRTLDGLFDGVDCVIHLAADKTGDFYDQMASTVVATENLLAAMSEQGVTQMVHCSTFSVYDYDAFKTGAVLNEQSKTLEGDPKHRDNYARTKLIQERLVVAWGEQNTVSIIRPGMIYGKGELWNAALGFGGGGNRFICTGQSIRIPMVYVDHCANAIALAAGCEKAFGQIINVVDDNPPTQRAYLKLIQQQTCPQKKLIRMPAWMMCFLAWSADMTNKIVFKGKAKTPSILVPARLKARIPKLRFDCSKAHDLLGWSPRYSLQEGVSRSGEEQAPVEALAQKEAEAPQSPKPVTELVQ